MRWAFGIVLVVVVGAVAAFAIYTWGWRDADGLDNERARAQVAAEQIAHTCREDDPPDRCRVVGLERIAGRLWRARFAVASTGKRSCMAIDLRYFRFMSNGETMHGAERVACPGEKEEAVLPPPPPEQQPPPPGPTWWTIDVARQRLEHSEWVRNSGLGNALFDCIGEGKTWPDDAELYRRFACTYEYGGPDLDQTGRIEIVTTGRDSFRVLSK